MDDVARYTGVVDDDGYHNPGVEMELDPNGDFVKYEDYKALSLWLESEIASRDGIMGAQAARLRAYEFWRQRMRDAVREVEGVITAPELLSHIFSDAVERILESPVVERQTFLMPCVECGKMVEPPFAPQPKDRVICGGCVERLRERQEIK